VPYKIVVDTREQTPLEFGPYKDCEGMVRKCLKVGDYTIEGMESIACIERKASTVEIARNFGIDRVRFYKELEKMKDFQYKFIVCEFSMEDMIKYPENSRVPKSALAKLKFDGLWNTSNLCRQ
jgi:ERCC4-type nuclease